MLFIADVTTSTKTPTFQNTSLVLGPRNASKLVDFSKTSRGLVVQFQFFLVDVEP